MSYFAESSGNTSGWQNQVAHGYHYGPSGTLELTTFRILIDKFSGMGISVAFRPRWEYHIHK